MNLKLTYLDEFNVECPDLLNSEIFINEFHSIVEKTNFNVYGLTGDWGIGKTCFIKMWEKIIFEETKPFVHIDAFKNDFDSEPFIMLLNAFTGLLEKIYINETDEKYENKKNIISIELKELKNKAKEIFTLKNISRFGFNIIVDKTIGKDNVKEFLGTSFESYFEGLNKMQLLHKELNDTLNKLMEIIDNQQLYIIVDELDRCRPDFALETLERIKHLFHLKNVKYILVYNEKVMNSIINNKYGTGIDANRYIDKFIQYKYQFNNIYKQINWFNDLLNRIFLNDKLSSVYNFLANYSKLIMNIKYTFHLTLRDMETIVNNLIQYKNENINLLIAIISCEYLKIINKNIYDEMYDYYIKNGQFSVNAPNRYLYNKIIDHFKNIFPHITADEAFYSIMDYSKSKFQ
jgi:predicted KAP-like P-loop ATPase